MSLFVHSIRAPPASSGHVTAINKEVRRVFEYKAPSTVVNQQVKGDPHI